VFEGPREFVEVQVALYSKGASKLQDDVPHGSLLAPQDHPQSLRDLVAFKQPKGHSEMVAVLAFGLAETGIVEFTEEEMRRAYIQAGARPPKVVSQALRDAKNKQDYIETGKKRGTYKISNHGDRTIRFDLPRG
jgi:hypothetical protein